MKTKFRFYLQRNYPLPPGQRLKRKSFPASTTRESNNKSGVAKREAYEALSELYAKAVVVQPGLSRCEDFRAAIIRMSEAVKDTKGTSYIRRWHSYA